MLLNDVKYNATLYMVFATGIDESTVSTLAMYVRESMTVNDVMKSSTRRHDWETV